MSKLGKMLIDSMKGIVNKPRAMLNMEKIDHTPPLLYDQWGDMIPYKVKIQRPKKFLENQIKIGDDK